MQNHYCFDRLDRHGLINRLALTNLPKIHCLPLDFAKSTVFFSSLGTIVIELLRIVGTVDHGKIWR